MRYFFRLSSEQHFAGADGIEAEAGGIELLDSEAAKTEAFRYFGEVLKETAETFSNQHELQLIVCNDNGVDLLRLTLSVSERASQASVHAAPRAQAIA